MEIKVEIIANILRRASSETTMKREPECLTRRRRRSEIAVFSQRNNVIPTYLNQFIYLLLVVDCGACLCGTVIGAHCHCYIVRLRINVMDVWPHLYMCSSLGITMAWSRLLNHIENWELVRCLLVSSQWLTCANWAARGKYITFDASYAPRTSAAELTTPVNRPMPYGKGANRGWFIIWGIDDDLSRWRMVNHPKIDRRWNRWFIRMFQLTTTARDWLRIDPSKFTINPLPTLILPRYFSTSIRINRIAIYSLYFVCARKYTQLEHEVVVKCKRARTEMPLLWCRLTTPSLPFLCCLAVRARVCAPPHAALFFLFFFLDENPFCFVSKFVCVLFFFFFVKF